jgi:lipoprotein NlpI
LKAAADFAGYTEVAPGDPYGWLWLYLAEKKLGKDEASKLKELAARRDAWPAMIIRHVAGLASAEEVLASVDVPDPKLKRLRLAEANYYLGELAFIAGNPARAETLFRSSLAVGRAEIEATMSLPVYKSDDDLELALANAALHGKGL